jgi:hypothetical protein
MAAWNGRGLFSAGGRSRSSPDRGKHPAKIFMTWLIHFIMHFSESSSPATPHIWFLLQYFPQADK